MNTAGSLSHSPQGSYTLSQIQINKVKLSKKKVELIGDRYALHFLGAASYDDPTSATDRVKINPKKKAVRISFDREEVEKSKDKDKGSKKKDKHHGKKEDTKEARHRRRRQPWPPIPLLLNPSRATIRQSTQPSDPTKRSDDQFRSPGFPNCFSARPEQRVFAGRR